MPRRVDKDSEGGLYHHGGRYIQNRNFGFDYVKGLLQGLFGIPEVQFFSAEGLDIQGNDPEAILNKAIAGVQRC